MVELIKAIALLCQISGNNHFVAYTQLKCQSFMVECIEKDKEHVTTDAKLFSCIKKRRLD